MNLLYHMIRYMVCLVCTLLTFDTTIVFGALTVSPAALIGATTGSGLTASHFVR